MRPLFSAHAPEVCSADAVSSATSAGGAVFVDYFRCPHDVGVIETAEDLSTDQGYFAFGGATCYGRLSRQLPVPHVSSSLPEVAAGMPTRRGVVQLPFDLAEVVTNLRYERYCQAASGWFQAWLGSAPTRALYYALRPLLPVGVRKHLQRLRLRDWESIAFPRWPIDDSADRILRTTLGLLIKQSGLEEIPFIWFWPESAAACTMMTHDVEGDAGRAFCRELAQLDKSYGTCSAFQMIPSNPLEQAVVNDLRRDGFEVNLHDLEHDGRLFQDRENFERRAAEINRLARQFQCRGFRAGAMYREQTWFDAFEFDYDMSVPNAAHLEPQRGGCCTVMPYFNQDLLELPLTTTQDYSLFHILGEYSVDRWKAQTEMLVAKNGLISFITHPDYLLEPRARAVYVELLDYLARVRSDRHLWMALPGEVNDWWRARREMTLVRSGSSWTIEGPESDRARIAYARLEGANVVYRLPGSGCTPDHAATDTSAIDRCM
jgi:hypothetical protein